MKEKEPEPKRKWLAQLTISQVQKIEALTRILMVVLVGLALTTLFGIVVLVVLGVALTGKIEQSAGLLNTVLTLVTTALGVVTGYVFGRNSPRK